MVSTMRPVAFGQHCSTIRWALSHPVASRRADSQSRCPLPPPPPALPPQRRSVACAAQSGAARGQRGREYGRRDERQGRDDDRREWAEEDPRDDMDRWMDRLASMQPATRRSVALLQLLRIEYEGAYSGLVSGPAAAGPRRSSSARGASGGYDGEDGDVAPAGRARGGGGGAAAGGARLDPRDRRAVTELVNGVTRWRRRLDYTLSSLSRKPLEEMDPPLLVLLRLGLYELAEINAPSHIVNEYVELAKQLMHTGAGAVANGMLRNVVRGLQAGTLPQPPSPAKGMTQQQAAEALALGSSHPTWMVQGWLGQYGPAATMALLRSNNMRPRYALRLMPGRQPEQACEELAELGVKARPSRYLPREFIVVEDGMQALLLSGWVERGDAQVQDEAAGLVVAMLDPQPGDRILDACAAPGGKTLFAAARMQGRGRILAMDVGPSRLAALRDMAGRQQYGACVRTWTSDLRQYAAQAAAQAELETAQAGLRQPAGAEQQPAGAAAWEEEAGSGGSSGDGGREDQGRRQQRRPPADVWSTQYDRVLVDAPCSGTGVLAKRADLRWKRTPEQVEQVVSLQAELLDAAASLVAPGGLLVFSTCSIERRENEDQVASFLQRHAGEFAVEPPPASAALPADCLSPEGFMLMLPHVHQTDGAFAARLRRRT